VCSQPWLNGYDSSSFCDYMSGVTWTRLDINSSGARLLPGRWVSSLAFAPGSASTLYLTLSGFDENTSGMAGHVFVTQNAGAASGTTWTNVTGTGKKAIPDLPANGIVIAPNGSLFVAADFGIFVSRDGGQTWQRNDMALPDAPIYDLALSPDGSTLYAATHGRGIWSASLHS
jgi:sugar lactone lactonase YvrE